MLALRTRKKSRDETLRPAGFVLVGVVVIAPQLIGGAPPWATLALSVLASGAAGLTFCLSRGYAGVRRSVIDPLLLAQVAVVALTVVHAVPLPTWFAASVAPDSYIHTAAIAEILRLPPPQWVPFTSDPGGSFERILFALAVLCIFAAARLLARATSPSTILAGVAASVILTGIVALAHRCTSATKVFGIYEPRFLPPPVWGPLMNPNNLAGLMVLGVPIMMGFSCRTDYPRPHRVGWLLAALLSQTTALLTLSRGGIAASTFGIVVFGALYLLKSSKRDPSTRAQRMRAVLVLGALLTAACALASWAGNDPLDENYRDVTKLKLFTQELGFLREHAWLGIGRGAFAAASSGFYEADGRALYAENIFLQYALEFGVPFTLLVLAIGFWRLTTGLLSWRSTSQLGGLVGVLAIGMQNIVDFSLELTGIGIVVAACLGAALPPFPRARLRDGARMRFVFSLRSTTGAASIGTIIACIALGPTVVATATSSIERDLGTIHEDQEGAFWGELFREAVQAHPADAGIALLGAVHAVQTANPDAPRWLNRAMTLAPFWSAPHSWAAHWLASIGRWDQALTELQLAAERDPLGTRTTLCILLKAQPRADAALTVAPVREPARTMVLETAAECLGSADDEVARVDAALLTAHPLHPEATARAAARRIKKGDWQGALQQLHPVLQMFPPSAAAYDTAARAWISAGRPDTAVQMTRDAIPQFDDPYPALLILANAQAHAGDLRGMRATVDELRGASRGDVHRLAKALGTLATFEFQTGNLASSMRLWREIYSLERSAFALATAANIARSLGDDAYAREASQELCREHGGEYCRIQ